MSTSLLAQMLVPAFCQSETPNKSPKNSPQPSAAPVTRKHLPELRSKEFDKLVLDTMNEMHTPGLAIGIVENGRLTFAKGYGVRKLGSPGEVDEKTIFAIGSDTKAFTAACIGTLVDSGKMTWDSKVTKFLPNFQLSDPKVTKEVTIRDLLTHRAGLDCNYYLSLGSGFSSDEIIRRLRYQPLKPFRKQFCYSNESYLVAGECAAAASRKTWENLVTERFLSPLHMSRTSISVTQLNMNEDVAWPHYEINGILKPSPYLNMDNSKPDGCMNSCVLDMSNWMIMLLNKGTFEGKRLISESSVDEMFRKQILETSASKKVPAMWYGLGWKCVDSHGLRLVFHDGQVPGMQAVVALLPEKNVGIVILTNQSFVPTEYALLDNLLDMYNRKVGWESVEKIRARYTNEKKAVSENDRQLDKWSLSTQADLLPQEKYVGNYSNKVYGDAKVSVMDGRLFLTLNGRPWSTLKHMSGERYLVHPPNAWMHDDSLEFWATDKSVLGFLYGDLGIFNKIQNRKILRP